MKIMTGRQAITLVLLFSSFSFAQWKKTPLQAPAQPNPQLYRAGVNAQEEIARATAVAGKNHKRVLLVFGGNWCIDCHVLENAFHQPSIAPMLNSSFVVVHVDVGEYTRNLDLAAKYHIDLKKGVPSVAVLDGRGGFLYSTSEFEKARLLNEEDVIQFLNKWKPPLGGI
jgi:thiol:disulfide interchange protein